MRKRHHWTCFTEYIIDETDSCSICGSTNTADLRYDYFLQKVSCYYLMKCAENMREKGYEE